MDYKNILTLHDLANFLRVEIRVIDRVLNRKKMYAPCQEGYLNYLPLEERKHAAVKYFFFYSCLFNQ